MIEILLSLMLASSADLRTNARALTPDQKIKQTMEEIEELQLSIASLDAVFNRLSDENEENEKRFQKTLKALLVPLLHWPGEAAVTNLPSWIEREHSALVLQRFQRQLIRQPLEMISDRELRLRQITSLRQEMEESILTLQRKRELLALQREEYKLLKKKRPKKVKQSPKPAAI